MTDHLKSLGYVFQYSKMDAQSYLLTQRRNRVYGTADIDQGQDAQLFRKRMSETLATMASDLRFPFEEVFDQTLPKTTLSGNAKEKVRQAIDAAAVKNETTNLFVDTSVSAERSSECAPGVTTCIRPSHPIWSVKLSRYLTVSELWRCQGLFKEDFFNQDAIEACLTDPNSAQDLCGNAFASTCAQAQLIASLVHGKGWKTISGQTDTTMNSTKASFDPFSGHLKRSPSCSPSTLASSSSFSDGFGRSKSNDIIPDDSSENKNKQFEITDFWTPEPAKKRARFDQPPAAVAFQAGCSTKHKIQYLRLLYNEN